MNFISFLFGVSGNITSLMIFLSPIVTFSKVLKHKSTENYDSLPYVCTLLSSSLWTYYGIIKPDGILVATVNGFGILVETIYVSFFLLFAPPRMKVSSGLGFVLGGAQLVLCCMYPSKHRVGELEEEQWKHEPLIPPSEQEVIDCNNQV